MAEPKDTTNKVYEYKLRTNKSFVEAADNTLWRCRQLYNACLEQRISHYLYTGKSPNWIEQSRQVTELRADDPAHASIPRDIQTDVIKRVERAYQAFFRRCKSGETPGFPRFKGRDRYNSFEYAVDQRQSFPLNGDKLTVKGIGSVRVRLSRELPDDAKIKTVRIVRRADGWYAQLVCEIVKSAPLAKTGEAVGVDMGIKSFAFLSTGKPVENPRLLNKASDDLTKAQQVLSRRKKGSKRRKRAKQLVAKKHLKLTRARSHFQYQEANAMVKEFDIICVEDLNIRGMVRNHCLAKAISDVAWGGFLGTLERKAEYAGRIVERVDARYTSQDCSQCGRREKKELAERWHSCPCGCELHRDHNAALNIRSRGLAAIAARQRAVNAGTRKGRNERPPQSGQSESLLPTRL